MAKKFKKQLKFIFYPESSYAKTNIQKFSVITYDKATTKVNYRISQILLPLHQIE